MRSFVVSLLLVFAAGCIADPEAEDSGPAPEESEADITASEPGTLRIMSFNIKNGEIAGHDMGKLTSPLLPSNPDVLALQEVDEGTARSGRLSETEEIAARMGMPYSYFGKNFAFDGGSYGVAIASKHPLSNAHVIRLDDHTSRANGYEPRIAAAADVNVGGKTITVVAVHASLHAEEHAMNAQRILADLGAKASRAIIMGDMNETPGGPIGHELGAAGFVDAYHEKHPLSFGFSIPASPVPYRRIDFMWRGKAFGRTVHAWVPDVTTSDHRPVASVVPLPK